MKRRKFLQSSAALSIPVALNGMSVAHLPYLAPLGNLEEESDRVLVLVQLIGGNDGLNTLIPLDKYDRLMELRGDIMMPQSQVLGIDNDMGLHPQLSGLKSLYEEAQIGIVQDVGYPNQNRSHFRSTDIWTSASAATDLEATGWMGRYFDEAAPGFPEAYPNPDNPDPFALAIGNTISATCQGVVANYSMAINDPSSISTLVESEGGSLPNNYYGKQLAYLRNTITQSNAYSVVLREAAEKGMNQSSLYPEKGANKLADQLKTVAQLIAGGLKTKVYVVSLGGFDTHSDQVIDGDPTQGRHATLLDTLSEAITAFQDDMNLLGLNERVLGMTFSEFGRRIRSNGSFGTDHGTAAPLLLFGNCVQSGILGTSPEIGAEVGVQTGIEMQFDFRDVYGSLLQDWFGLEVETIQQVLFPDYQYLPLVNDCSSLSTSTSNYWLERSVEIYPQPARDHLRIQFTNPNPGPGILLIHDLQGRLLKSYQLGNLPKGEHSIPLRVNDLPRGSYLLRLRLGNTQVSLPFLKH